MSHVSTANRRNRVFLVAEDKSGALIEEHELLLDEYYEAGHELIDSSSYRAKRQIRVVRGELYDPKGRLGQAFENRYDARGALVVGRTTHADGTTTEILGR